MYFFIRYVMARMGNLFNIGNVLHACTQDCMHACRRACIHASSNFDYCRRELSVQVKDAGAVYFFKMINYPYGLVKVRMGN